MKLLSFCALSLSVTGSAIASTTSNVAPIELSSLANDCTPEIYTDAGTIEAIRNTLAIYPFAIDGKNFDALSKVFSADAIANYSAPLNVLTPLSSIQSVLEQSLACVTTQHLFGTQWIDVLSPTAAQSITYFRAAHFGKENTEGQVLYAYGQYQDNWERQLSGTWRIVHRNLVYMVCLVMNWQQVQRLTALYLGPPNWQRDCFRLLAHKPIPRALVQCWNHGNRSISIAKFKLHRDLSFITSSHKRDGRRFRQ